MLVHPSKAPCVYILASNPHGILYTGVTSDLWNRMYDHVAGTFEGFTKKYGVKTLVYFEFHQSMNDAITREKRIKEWKRAWKIRLILGFNPEWLDLYDFETGNIAPGPADSQRFLSSQSSGNDTRCL
jgi:putative endonuclease